MLRNHARTLRSLGSAAAVLAAFALTLSAQTASSVAPSRIVQRVDENARVTLHGYVHPLANAANDRGAAPDSMPLTRMHLVLQRSASQEADLRQLIAGMHTPGNANYHKWLTPAQFGQRFGPSDQDVATVQSWLASHGFEVTGVLPGKQVVEFSGSAAQFREAFHAQIHKYEENGNTHFAAAGDPQIPAALSPVVGGFVALNDFHAKNYARVRGQASYDPKTHESKPEWTYGGTPPFNYVVTPADFGSQYDLPNAALNSAYSGTTYDGAGQTLAIINDANINLDLVQSFRTLFVPGYPATNLPTVIIDGNDPGVDGINNPDGPNFDSSEAYIDVEWSGAIAPKANIDLVIAGDTALEGGLFLAAEHVVYGDIAPVASLSFGACEANIGSTNAFLNQLWEQAAAQGQTIIVSSGDSGSAGCDGSGQAFAVNGFAVNGFASTPYNVALGGTDFYYSDYNNSGLSAQLATYWNQTTTQNPQASILQHIPEQPWNDSQYGLDALNTFNYIGDTSIGGGGGGASSQAVCANNNYDSTTGICMSTLSGYAKPAWQTGVTGTQGDKVRDIPDVSLFASDGANYALYPFCWSDADCQPASGGNAIQISEAGGTSFAAPDFAAIMALVNERYGAQGQADFVLYPLKAQFPAAFHDVTAGTIAVPCNIGTVGDSSGNVYPPLDCFAVANPLTGNDATYGSSVEGEIGLNNTPYYNASAGYNLATGLGSIDAAALLADWGSIHFKSTATTLSPSSTSFTHGTSITISGQVTGSTTPSGSVALVTNSSEPGNQGHATFALTNGSYSGSVSSLPGGTYDIWGRYSGDGTNAASNSAQTSITVNPENSSIFFYLLNNASTQTQQTATSSGQTVPYGTQLILDAEAVPSSYYTTCNVSSPPASCNTATYTIPTGTVSFSDNGTTINTAMVNVEGNAEFNAPFSVGTHSVTANYSGDNSYNKSSASAIAFTVAQDQPDLGLTASNEAASASSAVQVQGGQTTAFNVIVENSANDSLESSYGVFGAVPVAAPTGSVTVTGLPGGSATATLAPAVDQTTAVADSIAVIALPASAAAGTYNVTISYAGDANYAAVSGSGTVTITPASSLLASTTAASMTGSISATTNLTITGTVTGQSGHPAPTGVVELFSSGYQLYQTGYIPLTPGSGDTSTFSVTVNSQLLYQGTNLITVQYLGDTTYATSATTLNTSGISNPLSDFSITSASSLVPLQATATATTTVYVTPTNGFSGTVNLACAVAGSPTGVSCSLSQSSVALTYSNTASADGQELPPQNRPWKLLASGGGAALAGVLLLTIPARRRAWRNLLSLVLFACIAGFGIGCGSSGGGTTCTTNCGGGGGGTKGVATNPSQAVTLTITTSSAATGNYVVSVTGASTSTSQIHSAGVLAQVQ
ncbi:MAG TPA: Ig-like domain repeat protein [Acidobacteriaceae bacterium]